MNKISFKMFFYMEILVNVLINKEYFIVLLQCFSWSTKHYNLGFTLFHKLMPLFYIQERRLDENSPE